MQFEQFIPQNYLVFVLTLFVNLLTIVCKAKKKCLEIVTKPFILYIILFSCFFPNYEFSSIQNK